MTGLSSAQSQRFEADFTFYDNETSVNVENIELVKSRQVTQLNKDIGNYKFVMETSGGEKVLEGKRLVSFNAIGPPTPNGTSGVSISQDSRKMKIYFNYTKEARFLTIYENNEVAVQIDLVNEICNDSVTECTEYCAYHEASPESCEAGKNDTKQKDKEEIGDVPRETKIIFIGLVFSVLVAILTLYQKKRLISRNE